MPLWRYGVVCPLFPLSPIFITPPVKSTREFWNNSYTVPMNLDQISDPIFHTICPRSNIFPQCFGPWFASRALPLPPLLPPPTVLLTHGIAIHMKHKKLYLGHLLDPRESHMKQRAPSRCKVFTGGDAGCDAHNWKLALPLAT